MRYNAYMKARYQYRFYPTSQQSIQLSRLFGCCRVVWNDALRMCRDAEKLPRNGDLQKVCITLAKKTTEREWLSEVSNIPLQQSIADLGVAYKNFFDSLSGKRKGKKANPPRFKKRSNEQSARFARGGFSLKGSKVFLAKIGRVKVKWSRALPSTPSSVTVIKDCCDRYFLSFVVEVEPKIAFPLRDAIGVDLGIKTFASLSTGERVQSPGYERLKRKIKRLQRRLARQQRGSNRRAATCLRIAKLNAKIRDIRKDFLHKLSTRLVRDNQAVCLEDLNVSGMVKNRCLSRAISEQGWREFRVMCESKAAHHVDREVNVISRWEPTSQICSTCGYKWGKLDLSVRSVLCVSCGTEHDRDDNAALNIEKSGVAQSQDSKWTVNPRKPSTRSNGTAQSSQPYSKQLALFA
jgi:putative transposase